MKIIVFVGIVLFNHCSILAQKTMTFEEARQNHIRTAQLDSLYQSGIHADSTQSVFKPGQQEAYIAAYQQMLQDLGKFLKSKHFLWEKPVRGFNRIYFAQNGKIDYFLYSFKPGQLNEEQEKQFQKLLGNFAKNYRFPLQAPVKFAQCSPVTYAPTSIN